MRIWLITTNFQGGGAERVMINMAAGLRERGHDVRLLATEHRVEYELPPSLAPEFLYPATEKISKGWFGKRFAARRLRDWARRQTAEGRPDLVITSLPFADEIVRRAGIPDVWYRIPNPLSPQVAGLQSIDARKARRRIARFKRLYSGQNVIAISHGVKEDLQKSGIQGHHPVTIYNPLDTDEIRRRAGQPEPDLPDEPFIVHAGRFVPQKRHDVLLDAFAAAALPHRLVLLTRHSSKLEDMIAERGLSRRVTIAGFRQNPYPWLARAAVLVHSSDYEGFGNVLAEALACGTPVVSTDCPVGPREILSGNLSRYLSPPGDAGALARNLVECINVPPAIDPASLARFSRDNALDAIESLAHRGHAAPQPADATALRAAQAAGFTP